MEHFTAECILVDEKCHVIERHDIAKGSLQTVADLLRHIHRWKTVW